MERPRYNVHLRTSGDIAVGKTSLLLRWFQDTFSSVELVTIGGDVHSKVVDIRNMKVKVEMIDTGGQEKFRQITSSFYRKTHGLMLVYDVCSRASFDAIRTSWFKEAERYMSGDIKVMMLVGNKEDKVAERVVSTDEGKRLAADLGIDHFLETSCSEAVNVEEAFDLLIGSVVEKMEAKKGPGTVSTRDTISIGEEPEKKKKGCVLW